MQAEMHAYLCSLFLVNLVLLRIVPQLLCDLHPADACELQPSMSQGPLLWSNFISARPSCPHEAWKCSILSHSSQC